MIVPRPDTDFTRSKVESRKSKKVWCDLKVTTFEDLEVWKKSMELSTNIYEITSRGNFSEDYGLRDQIRRSVVSIASNVAEGFEREGDQEFIRFLSIAKGSAGEVRTQLILANKIGYLSDEITQRLTNNIREISKLIVGLINYLKKSESDNE